MNKLFQQALFVIPIAVLIATPFVMDHQNKEVESNVSSSGMFALNSHSNHENDVDFDLPHVVDNEQFAMSEPFSEHSFFIHPCNMGNPMDPAAWMNLMISMMNYMQITQMMQQMTRIPAGMSNPSAPWMNPYMKVPNQSHSANQPLSPEEYEKWYNEQLKK